MRAVTRLDGKRLTTMDKKLLGRRFFYSWNAMMPAALAVSSRDTEDKMSSQTGDGPPGVVGKGFTRGTFFPCGSSRSQGEPRGVVPLERSFVRARFDRETFTTVCGRHCLKPSFFFFLFCLSSQHLA